MLHNKSVAHLLDMERTHALFEVPVPNTDTHTEGLTLLPFYSLISAGGLSVLHTYCTVWNFGC